MEPSSKRSAAAGASRAAPFASLLGFFFTAGCALLPPGFAEEEEQLTASRTAFAAPIAERRLPELSSMPEFHELLERAYRVHGEIEMAFYEWQAALERVRIAASYPNTNVNLGAAYQFSSGGMPAFDRMTFSGGFDEEETLAFPLKTRQAGKVALAEARAARERFRATHFAVKTRIVTAWAEYGRLAAHLHHLRESALLAEIAHGAAVARIAAGGPVGEALEAELERLRVDNELIHAEVTLGAARAELNALLSRPVDAPLEPPSLERELRALPFEDAELLAVGAALNPELAALARDAEARRDAVNLARMRWIPDLSPFVEFTGSLSQSIGLMLTLPSTIAEIRGVIAESRALASAAEARARQVGQDRAANFVATLIHLRDHERQARFLSERLRPVARRLVETAARSYSAAEMSQRELLDSRRTLLELDYAIAETRGEREKHFAELEALAGVDLDDKAESERSGTGAPPLAAATKEEGDRE